ncbi:MAG TPA: glycosyltransferase [Candidatus Saccharimonas sp.]|nr:glycosyltransferase [Candidatus Saccharimonas sp.]
MNNFLFTMFWLSTAIGVLNTLHIGFYLVSANVYDIKQMKHRAERKRSNRKLPLVTIAISAHNEEKVIIRTLESLIKVDYPRLQIIVMDDASRDSTSKLINNFIANHPKFDITIRYKTKNVGKGRALNAAIQRYAKGEFVMTLDADCILHPQAIRNAVRYFDDPSVAGVAANVRIIREPGIISLLQMLEHMIGYRSKKAYSLTNSECIIGGVGSTYRRSVMKHVNFYDTDTLTEDIGLSMKVAAQGNKHYRLVYGADVVAMTEGVATFKALLKQRYRWKYGMLQNLIKYSYLIGKTGGNYSRMLTWYRLPMAFLSELLLLIEPLILGYIVYLAYLIHNPGAIFGSYALITIYLLLNLLPDEHSTRRDRWRLAFYAPVAYFIFYIMNIVQLVAIVRCLLNVRKLVGRHKVDGTWHSPERRGAVQVKFSKGIA